MKNRGFLCLSLILAVAIIVLTPSAAFAADAGFECPGCGRSLSQEKFNKHIEKCAVTEYVPEETTAATTEAETTVETTTEVVSEFFGDTEEIETETTKKTPAPTNKPTTTRAVKLPIAELPVAEIINAGIDVGIKGIEIGMELAEAIPEPSTPETTTETTTTTVVSEFFGDAEDLPANADVVIPDTGMPSIIPAALTALGLSAVTIALLKKKK